MPDEEKKVCGSPLRGRPGRFCKKRPMENGRCRLHGGLSPRGMDSPHFKHGRYSRDIPPRLAARLEAAENDPELLSARSEVALLDIRVKELVQRLDTGESRGLWKILREQWKELQAASAVKDMDAFQSMLATIGRTIQNGARYESVWDELANAIDDRTKIARAEHNRLVDLQQMITAQEAMTLFTAVVSTVMSIVTDENQRREIGLQLEPLLTSTKGGKDLVIDTESVIEQKRKRQKKGREHIEKHPTAFSGKSNLPPGPQSQKLPPGHEWVELPSAEELTD